MPSVMAIISKAVFEELAPKGVAVGDLIETDRYVSRQPAFAQVGAGDAIYLVTVRPPKEALWLVAVLDGAKRKGDAWVGTLNTQLIKDITPAIKKLRFATGTGISAKKGALGMSLQTPRVLTADDVVLLRGGGKVAKPSTAISTPAKPKGKASPAKAFTDAELFEALASMSYVIYSDTAKYLSDTLAAMAPEAAVVRAKQLCDMALTHSSRVKMQIGARCMPIVARAEGIPAAYADLVTTYGRIDDVRFVLGRLPLERRVAILRRDYHAGDASRDRVVGLLDLAPEVTLDVLDSYRKSDRPSWALINDLELSNKADEVPAIAKMLKAYEHELATRPKPAPAPSGPFTFVDPVVVPTADTTKLDPVALAQWRVAASAYIGGAVKTAAQFLAKLAKDELDEGDGEMRQWKVERDGKHVYDVWIVWVDNGSVFGAGEKSSAGVHLVQGDWQALDRKSSSKQLAEELAASAPQDLWTVTKKRRP